MMTEHTEARPKLSRRRFGALALGSAGAAVVGGVTVFKIIDPDDDGAIGSFEVLHDPSVYVTMTNGEEFVVEVRDTGTRRVLERHERVTGRNLLGLQSEYVGISRLT